MRLDAVKHTFFTDFLIAVRPMSNLPDLGARLLVPCVAKRAARKPRADPRPPGEGGTEIVARLLNHLAGVAQPVNITVQRY